MDRERKKKLAAQIAAIIHFEEENQLALASAAAPCGPPQTIPLWSLAGRQDTMLMRTLLQRRLGRSM